MITAHMPIGPPFRPPLSVVIRPASTRPRPLHHHSLDSSHWGQVNYCSIRGHSFKDNSQGFEVSFSPLPKAPGKGPQLNWPCTRYGNPVPATKAPLSLTLSPIYHLDSQNGTETHSSDLTIQTHTTQTHSSLTHTQTHLHRPIKQTLHPPTHSMEIQIHSLHLAIYKTQTHSHHRDLSPRPHDYTYTPVSKGETHNTEILSHQGAFSIFCVSQEKEKQPPK